jgi:hypothetical protein
LLVLILLLGPVVVLAAGVRLDVVGHCGEWEYWCGLVTDVWLYFCFGSFSRGVLLLLGKLESFT